MKVYEVSDGGHRLIGRADVPDDGRPVYEVPLFGTASVIVEQFTISAVAYHQPGSGSTTSQPSVVLSVGQPPEILPGWQPLAS